MKEQKKFKLTTPVLFIVFNRPDTTRRVFSEIKKAKPPRLYIAADGPRTWEEKKKTDAVRNHILKNVNWKCEIKTLFRDKNLGCKYAVSSAIDWFFKNEEKGIILEDDCIPSQSFFRFCQEMLEKYKNNEKIMHISGTNVEEISPIKEDYFFADAFNVWGWATWKRAWKHYDVEMKDWPKWRIKSLGFMKEYSLINKIKSLRLYELTYRNKINTWDYQWDFCCKKNGGISIIPRANLITNIGFDNGTHTTNYEKDKFTLKRYRLKFPLKANLNIKDDKRYLQIYSAFFGNKIVFRIFKE